jgi:hypothetical protein
MKYCTRLQNPFMKISLCQNIEPLYAPVNARKIRESLPIQHFYATRGLCTSIYYYIEIYKLLALPPLMINLELSAMQINYVSNFRTIAASLSFSSVLAPPNPRPGPLFFRPFRSPYFSSNFLIAVKVLMSSLILALISSNAFSK